MEEHEKKLRQEILDEANKRADRIVVRGKKDAENTVKKAKADSAERRRKRIAEAEAEAEEKRKESQMQLEKSIKDKWAFIREQCINELLVNWCKAKLALRSGSEERMKYLKVLITDAVSSLKRSDVILKVCPEDLPYITEEWLKSICPDKNITVVEGKRLNFGVIATSKSGRVVYNNSIYAVVRRQREEIRRQIAYLAVLDFLKGKL